MTVGKHARHYLQGSGGARRRGSAGSRDAACNAGVAWGRHVRVQVVRVSPQRVPRETVVAPWSRKRPVRNCGALASTDHDRPRVARRGYSSYGPGPNDRQVGEHRAFPGQ